mmetsp:Transcript_60134/g.196409  ORF Transcript_60134/g.196409 Transcript_60134/m.196409 type:complete len:637 (-) Transcript_60134:434-2344(-)
MGGLFSTATHVPEGATLWRYSPENGARMGIRKAPKVDAELSKHVLKPNEVFWVVEELAGDEDVVYLRLLDGRGWSFDMKPNVGEMCVRELTPHEAVQEALVRVEERIGRTAVRSQYHRLPKRLEEDYVVKPRKVLGSGCNGDVLMGTNRHTSTQVAIKHLDLTAVSMEAREMLVNEVEIALSMDHPHIARLTDLYEGKDTLTLVMDKLDGGELFDRVVSQGHFSEEVAADSLRQILLAVRHLHRKGVAHRDIKLENFLFESKDSNFIKLIDFGLAKFCGEGECMTDCCGTVSYMAPEVLRQKYTVQSDMWSVGVIAYVLLAGCMPFRNESEEQTIKDIRKANYSLEGKEWSGVSPLALDFVRSLLELRPEVRLTAEQALQHPWLSQLGEAADATGSLAGLFGSRELASLQSFGRAGAFRRACLRVAACSALPASTASSRAAVLHTARESFLRLDAAGTGALSLSDVRSELLDAGMPTDQCDAICSALGESHAHEQSVVCYSDFVAAMMTEVSAEAGVLADAFSRLDDAQHRGRATVGGLLEVLGPHAGVEEAFAEMDWRDSGAIAAREFMAHHRSSSQECLRSAAAALSKASHAAASTCHRTLQQTLGLSSSDKSSRLIWLLPLALLTSNTILMSQ